METNQVKKIGDLARIELLEDEQKSLGKDFTQILQYIHKISELKLDDVDPASHPFRLKNAFREDEVKDCDKSKSIIDLAPQHDRNMIQVPNVIKASSNS